MQVSEIATTSIFTRPPVSRQSAKANDITFSIATTSVGEVLVARTTIGVCSILIGSDRDELEQDLARRFPKSRTVLNEVDVRHDMEMVTRFIENPKAMPEMVLDMKGTEFQRRVWEALRKIPAGTTVSYTELAMQLNAPKSARAVAMACASNPIAMFVPCHRVVRNNGDLAGYRWGIERKRQLIDMEASA
jgi:O-6-methylguanine DNA methyltransferase